VRSDRVEPGDRDAAVVGVQCGDQAGECRDRVDNTAPVDAAVGGFVHYRNRDVDGEQAAE
jgi:hypothetical protein